MEKSSIVNSAAQLSFFQKIQNNMENEEKVNMQQTIKIRNERKSDHAVVESITRKAFYNLYRPGCVEHYLVHIMRTHEDFIPGLDFVLELNGGTVRRLGIKPGDQLTY